MIEEKDNGEFYEAMPVATGMGMTTVGSRFDTKQTVGFTTAVVLLMAALGGFWTALQSNGQILGLFAFNGWNTALAVTTGIMALYAAFDRVSSRVIWSTLAIVFGVMTVLGLIVHGGQVIGLFANNYNNVWAYLILTVVFGYLGTSNRSIDY